MTTPTRKTFSRTFTNVHLRPGITTFEIKIKKVPSDVLQDTIYCLTACLKQFDFCFGALFQNSRVRVLFSKLDLHPHITYSCFRSLVPIFSHKPASNNPPLRTMTSFQIMQPASFECTFYILSYTGPSWHFETRPPRSYRMLNCRTRILRFSHIRHRDVSIRNLPGTSASRYPCIMCHFCEYACFVLQD